MEFEFDPEKVKATNKNTVLIFMRLKDYGMIQTSLRFR